MSRGNWGSRLTSRATLGARSDASTCPTITSSTSRPRRAPSDTGARAQRDAPWPRRARHGAPSRSGEGRAHPGDDGDARPVTGTDMLRMPRLTSSTDFRAHTLATGRQRSASTGSSHFAPVHDIKAARRAGRVPRAAGDAHRPWVPSPAPLVFEEGFDDEQPARANRIAGAGEPWPVEIVEDEHGVEVAPAGQAVLRSAWCQSTRTPACPAIRGRRERAGSLSTATTSAPSWRPRSHAARCRRPGQARGCPGRILAVPGEPGAGTGKREGG